MSNQNHFFVGNLTRDPEVRNVNGKNGDVSVVSFSVAVNGRTKDDVVYFECEAWGKQAELIGNPEYFKKGVPIVVLDAEARNDTWEDKTSGEKRSRLKFRVNRFGFAPLNSKSASEPKSEPETEPTTKKPTTSTRKTKVTSPPVEDDDDGEIPF